MRSLFFALILMLGSLNLQAQQMQPVNNQSVIKFQINNFGLANTGYLSNPKGVIIFNKADVASAKFDVSVPLSTINTDNEKRDRHLRSADFFDEAKFPVIRIASTSIEKGKKANTYMFNGTLTIKDITRPIKFGFTVLEENGTTNFEGGFKINRLDFGVGKESATMGDDVNISLKIAAK